MTDLEDALRPIVRQLVAEALAERQPAAAADHLMSVEDAAARLGIGRTAAYELIAARDGLRSVKVGRRRLVASSDLAAYIEATRRAG